MVKLIRKRWQKRTLLLHQEHALTYARGRKAVAWFMEMRLGKTLTAIRWAQENELNPILVVAPLTVLAAWEKELRLEGESEICYLTGLPKKTRWQKLMETPARWYLITYESLRSTPTICELPWRLVIADESTKIRNPKAQITKLMRRQLAHVPYRALLSGLPAPEDIIDYFEQMCFLHGSFMGYDNYWSFRQRYFQPGWGGFGWIAKKGTVEAVRTAVQETSFMLTRKDAGIGSKKIYEKRYVYLPTDARKVYEEATKDWQIGDSMTKWAPVVRHWLARIAGGFSPEGQLLHDAKLKALLELLEGELKRESVVVWFRYNHELRYVAKMLRKRKISCVEVYGDVKREDREKARVKFEKKKARIFLGQVKCAKFGVDCSVADTTIYYSNSYENEDRMQSEDRVIHPTKKIPLLYIDLVVKDTVDEDAVFAVREKRRNSRRAMTSIMEGFFSRMEKSHERRTA